MKQWDNTPRANPQNCIRLTHGAEGISLWAHLTDQSLETVLKPGYFDLCHRGLERHDRIVITAKASLATPDHANLVVMLSQPGHGVDVAVLERLAPRG